MQSSKVISSLVQPSRFCYGASFDALISRISSTSARTQSLRSFGIAFATAALSILDLTEGHALGRRRRGLERYRAGN
jgi:hypothetical protein